MHRLYAKKTLMKRTFYDKLAYMQISWKGQACFSLIAQRNKQEQVRIIIDPFDPSIGLKLPSLEADIVLVTHDHEDHNNWRAVKGDPFLITNPGEYETKEVFVQGMESFHDDVSGKERGMNTIYVIEAEGIRICHLGDIGQAELSSDQIEKIGNIDLLLVPVGGVYTVGAKNAAKIVSQIEPRMVIPMHYLLPQLKFKLEKVDEFLRILGVKNTEPQNKLVVKARDFSSEEMQVVVLAP